MSYNSEVYFAESNPEPYKKAACYNTYNLFIKLDNNSVVFLPQITADEDEGSEDDDRPQEEGHQAGPPHARDLEAGRQREQAAPGRLFDLPGLHQSPETLDCRPGAAVQEEV